MSGHDIIVFGPVSAGDRMLSGDTYRVAGWGWSCSCGCADHGFIDEMAAEQGADAHERCSV